MARKNSSKGYPKKRNSGELLWDKLRLEEVNVVLRELLKNHPELQPEADELARSAITSPSTEEIADETFQVISDIGLDELNGRAGSHSWGYVEPSEAACELLEESLEDLIENMKRQSDLGLANDAEAICEGIVVGLYRARNVNSDGALGWAPDFPVEQAGQVIQEYLRPAASTSKSIASQSFLEHLATRVPEWSEMIHRAVNQSANK
jgi:hypothetical protein